MTAENREQNPLRKKLGLDVSEIIDDLKRKFPDENGVNRRARRLYELINHLTEMRNSCQNDKQAQAIIGEFIFDAQEKLEIALRAETGGVKPK